MSAANVEAADLAAWLKKQLCNYLGFPPGDDLVSYILTLENSRTLEEHLSGLIDLKEPDAKAFLKEFIKRWTALSVAKGSTKAELKDFVGKTKTHQVNRDTTRPKNNVSAASHKEHINKENVLPRKGNFTKIPDKMVVDTRGAEFLDKNKPMPEELQKNSTPFKKKHLKYVPLYSTNGEIKTGIVMLPGRHACQCLAQKHKLINNCIECGRIVCEQEGSGPCIFCGNLVCSVEEQEILARESKKSKKLMEKLLGQTVAEVDEMKEKSLTDALAHKDKLLEFDKNCTKRTKVIDDEADYFSSDNRWMTTKQKDELTKRDNELRGKRFVARRDQKFTIDFAGRKITEDETQNYMHDGEDPVVRSDGAETSDNFLLTNEERTRHPLIDPRITIQPPKFSSSGFHGDVTQFLKSQQQAVKNSLRLQDKELQEMVDQGICLSMHQPWASLLVCGIKRLEGRSWYSAHRGRLWIASTAKPAEKELIQTIEKQYQYFFPGESLKFPKDYPSGVLLGCVTVSDCASNEEYFKKHPDCEEENDSPFIFVCEHPQELKIKFQMKGSHKLYKLETHIHAAAKKNLHGG